MAHHPSLTLSPFPLIPCSRPKRLREGLDDFLFRIPPASDGSIGSFDLDGMGAAGSVDRQDGSKDENQDKDASEC